MTKVEATVMDLKKEEMSVVKVEKAVFIDIKEDETSVVKFEEEMLVDTKEDFPGDVNSPTTKVEHDQVSFLILRCVISVVLVQ
jgi:hypothetical protein